MSSSDISQIIDALVAAIERLETSTEPNARDVKDCEAAIQKMFEAANANDVDKDEKTQKVLFEIIEKGVLKSILYHMPEFNPRTRQSIKHIWLISLKSEKLKNTIDDYIRENPEILILLIRGYTKEEMIQTYGDILRFCIKHSSMLYLILFSPLVWQFFQFVTADAYEKSSDAFKTFKMMLTRSNPTHKKHVSKFLKENFKMFFSKFRILLTDDRYHVKRQSLRLLSEVLQARENFKTMVAFISDEQNLELMIKHLCQTEVQKKGIKSEAFHVFKFFVANPRKPRFIVECLTKHKARLIDTLKAMEKDGTDYGRELPLLIQRLSELPDV
mmetsp:Transcript_4452/g.8114  ORF Transcript_4452/g.8114 Transcript_4452/m.8114 type:complete len:329 (-) Transcript_4452:118-1104(-)|eukprot:CAMPEP_0197540772 /NCGR_PEP_ID=MMETSP1318-20131121/66787_1 /TAXON_ID=552666 /ORGANISM="Partenskyella glossopodia, Strain RCC365" /LENGTH=328 /DNA_ID=CAMNT_0043099869 /DNA_START=596 /DNA_END=1582 /DNA_ORIENTATION=-